MPARLRWMQAPSRSTQVRRKAVVPRASWRRAASRPPAMPRPHGGGGGAAWAFSAASAGAARRRRGGLLGARALGRRRQSPGLDRRRGDRLLGGGRRWRLGLFLRFHRCGLDRCGRFGRAAAASAAVPLAGSVNRTRVQRSQQQLRYVEHLGLRYVIGCGDVVDTVMIITRQNGQPVAIFEAPVSSASSTRSW